jgi:hypothetical protein
MTTAPRLAWGVDAGQECPVIFSKHELSSKVWQRRMAMTAPYVGSLALAVTVGACGSSKVQEATNPLANHDGGGGGDDDASDDGSSAMDPSDGGEQTTIGPDGAVIVTPKGDGGTTAVQTPSPIPALLPKRMLIGIEDNDGTWMVASKVKWDVRWAYFTANVGTGWYNGFAGGAASTDWALNWMQTAVGQGYIPLVQYYVLQTDYQPQSDIGTGLLNSSKTGTIQTPATMKDYFTKFKLLMTAAKQLGKPVIVIVEGDVFGFLEIQSKNDPTTYAAIADSGMPELAGLPNTIAGFGLAYLALRKSVGATNVIMGPDVPAYAANGDFLNYGSTDPVQPHVDYQYTGFFSKLGVGANSTGAVYDFTATCPASEDTDQYIANGDTGRSWSASDSASVNTESLNRYADWLTLFNKESKTPWVIWQIPMGDSNSPDVYNQEGAWAGPYKAGYTLPAGCTASSKTGCPGGYKDNRPEYFLGTERTQHLTQFAAAGVFGLFFGPGASGSSDQTSDYYTDGQLFIKSRGGSLISAGGFPLQ